MTSRCRAAIGLAAAAMAVLAACGTAGAPPSPRPCSTPSGVQTLAEYASQVCDEPPPMVPMPSVAQHNRLLEFLSAHGIEATDVTGATASFRSFLNTCVSILGGASDREIAAALPRWTSSRLHADDAVELVGLVRQQGWCSWSTPRPSRG